VTLPLPGIIAGSIQVFIPSMGMFVVPDLIGGAKTVLVGNLIRNQFLTARDWPFGSAASMVLMVLTLALTLVYTRFFGFGRSWCNERAIAPGKATIYAILAYVYLCHFLILSTSSASDGRPDARGTATYSKTSDLGGHAQHAHRRLYLDGYLDYYRNRQRLLQRYQFRGKGFSEATLYIPSSSPKW
jgi:hypothetical protein